MKPVSFLKSTIATNIVTTNTEPKLSVHIHRMYLKIVYCRFENKKCMEPAVAVKRGALSDVTMTEQR